jgi:hypothetical protein
VDPTQMKRGFLIMPFSDDLDWLHDDIVAAGIAEKVLIERADNVFSPGVILDQIFTAIDTADVVIAVCTGKNANVFFELGYAWHRHRPILIAESTADLPFDVSHYRTELYGGDSPGQHRATLRSRLRKAISGASVEDHLPRGVRLSGPPRQKAVPRLTGQLQDVGRGHRLVITNAGTVEIRNITVEVPKEAVSFHLHGDDLPIDALRPGEQVSLLVSRSMGGGPRIFDLQIRGKTADGESVEFRVKIS